MSSQCPDTGIQKSLLVSKQTSIESGYNVFDEIIWKTGSQCLGTGMTPFLAEIILISQCSYSCGGMT
ncbi:hypothetical protein INQ25_05480 [Wolbachia endosymbiont of Rhagoletis cerasi]|uniref:hypothetical protein n=1 Tax=Wolbachia endosymbiont of Rhagoletis cerasi TaxID=225363 RepID=UPI001BD4A647|nr:hypothetical protein [Wolbachia endosymbiont of Rhagoletis cerasi]MBS9530815.1 hypothetical protein [Wolbachia endosymbiont of Rhagoletis cerasi]